MRTTVLNRIANFSTSSTSPPQRTLGLWGEPAAALWPARSVVWWVSCSLAGMLAFGARCVHDAGSGQQMVVVERRACQPIETFQSISRFGGVPSRKLVECSAGWGSGARGTGPAEPTKRTEMLWGERQGAGRQGGNSARVRVGERVKGLKPLDDASCRSGPCTAGAGRSGWLDGQFCVHQVMHTNKSGAGYLGWVDLWL